MKIKFGLIEIDNIAANLRSSQDMRPLSISLLLLVLISQHINVHHIKVNIASIEILFLIFNIVF